MLKEERHQKILDEVSLRNRILLLDMAAQLNVSIDTIRRDVKELDKKQLSRVLRGEQLQHCRLTSSDRGGS